MYALSFDMVVSDLKQYYGEPYNKAYYEIKSLLKDNGFTWVQGSTYLTANDDLTALVKVVMELSKIDWFKKSVRDLRGFKVESWSDFTSLVKTHKWDKSEFRQFGLLAFLSEFPRFFRIVLHYLL